MPKLKLILMKTEVEDLLESEVNMEFLPRIGDSINAYDLVKDLKKEDDELVHFFLVYDVCWIIKGSDSEVIVKATPHDYSKRASILTRYGWLGEK